MEYQFSLAQDEGLKNLGIITGVITPVLGMMILAVWFVKYKRKRKIDILNPDGKKLANKDVINTVSTKEDGQ